MLSAHVEAVWQAVAPVLPGFTVELLPSIDSTNTELMRRSRMGPIEPVLLVAEQQTAGRGRLGRHWYSQPGQSLTFSLALPMAVQEWSGLSLAVGVSLADALHPDARLKWPNDLWLLGRKLGGILVETAGYGERAGLPRSVVVGVGINIARPSEAAFDAPGPEAMPAMAPAGMAEVLMGVTAGELLERVVPPLVNDLRVFETAGFGAFADRFAARDALKDRLVQLSDGTLGTACGVGPDGALQVLTREGMRAVTSAEVSVRPC